MNLSLLKTYYKFLFILLIFVGQQVIGQVNMSTTGSHSQDFNTLASTGATNAWTNNSTIANWYSQRTGTGTTYEASNGGATAGNLYSYGAVSNSERALGALGSGNAAAGSFAHGVLLRNTSGTTITDINVTYTLEEWRKSGVTTAQDITFYYKISSSTITALNPNVNTGWTQVTGLTLSSPINTTTAATLNGNLPANRVTASNISITSLSLANNDYIMLKWEDPDHTGSDHGLAIDDVTINWTIAPAGPTVTTNAATSIATNGADLNGTINANGTTTNASFEYGTTVAYGSSATATPSTASGTSDTSISATIGSLALNTQYHFRAVGTVSAVPTNGSNLTFYTLAATPGVAVINNAQLTTLDVTVNSTTENSNPSATEYAIQEIGGQYVQANGTLGATAVWQTASVWATKTVTGLTAATSYTFQVKARNGANVETAFGSTASGTTLTPETADYNVVQFPNTTQNITEGTSFTVYIRAYEGGITTIGGSSSRLKAWVGYSSINENPSNLSWTWVPATFNVQVGNDDEYQANIPGTLLPGTYYYAARFEIDDSMVYTYGGAGGNWNNNSVVLNVAANVVDYANIQFPTTATITEGNTVTVYAQVYEPGITPGAGQGAGITAEIGYFSTNTTPDGTWTWLPTTHNPSQTGNNDEYQANLGAGLAPGTYYYASRFIKTGSSVYVYGGTNGVWNNDNGVLTINALGTPTATAANPIEQTQFNANWNTVSGASSYEVEVYTKSLGQTEVINQTFTWSDYSLSNGTGGNSGGWSGSIAINTFDIPNWTDIAGYRGDNCAKMGTGSARGAITTPVFGVAGEAVLTFRAGAWDGASEQTTLLLEISGGGTLSASSVTMIKGAFSNYSVNITGATANTQVTFRAFQISNARFFIDDIKVDVSSENLVQVLGSPFTTSSTSQVVSGLNPETTYYYVVRAINGSVESVNSNEIEVQTKPTSVTWNGTAWSNIDGPDATIEAVLTGVYSTTTNGGFTAKKVTVSTGGSLTVNSGTSVTVVNELINELTETAVVVESNGSLIQNGTTNQNSGNITVNRSSQDLMRLDYTMWSSPVEGQVLAAFSPLTMANRFYTYSSSSNVYTAIANTNSFTVGQGYLIRMPDNHPTSPTAWNGAFIGKPNSGTITIGLSTAGTGFNAVGNPYPSPISIATFLSENSSVIGSDLYFWRKTNGAAGSAYVTFSGGSFSDGPHTNNTIQPGQGFIVQATNAADLTFTNTQRNANNGVFYRNGNVTESEESSRIWLNLKSNDVVIGQMAVGYRAEATNSIDADFDAEYINDSALALNSIVEGTELAVQHRATFMATDVVPLSFKTTTAGTFVIAINEVDGLFTNVEQNIYLKDNLLNVEHDLRSAPYSFVSEIGVFANRFEIVYQSALSVDNPTFGNGVVVYSKNKTIEINSGNEMMSSVKVFDIRGRIVAEKVAVNATSTAIDLSTVANQVLIIQITAENGQTVSRKVVH